MRLILRRRRREFEICARARERALVACRLRIGALERAHSAFAAAQPNGKPLYLSRTFALSLSPVGRPIAQMEVSIANENEEDANLELANREESEYRRALCEVVSGEFGPANSLQQLRQQP